MSDVENDEPADPVRDQVTEEQLNKALVIANVKPKCNLCDSENWFYTMRDKQYLAWYYIDVDSPSETGLRYGLSYYSRTCLSCGNKQSFARVVIRRILDDIDAEEKLGG